MASKPVPFKTWMISSLRRASYRWPARYMAFNAAKIGRNQYVCKTCSQVKGRKDVRVDHIIPVVDADGFKDWNTYIPRLFCPQENFQVLCKDCHNVKIAVEREGRKQQRALTKPPKKAKVKKD